MYKCITLHNNKIELLVTIHKNTNVNMNLLSDEESQLHEQINQIRNATDQLRLEAIQLRLESVRLRNESDQLRQSQLLDEQIRSIVAAEIRLIFPQIIPEIINHAIINPTIIKKVLSKEEAEAVMDDDCVICLATHKMTDACTINCGHQFGRLCLANWNKDTCPLCRTTVTEITEFIVTEDISLF